MSGLVEHCVLVKEVVVAGQFPSEQEWDANLTDP